MVNAETCPVCDSQDLFKEPGFLSRIITWRSTGIDPGKNVTNQKVTCNECKFIFSELRLTESEKANYYLGYRDETYIKQRKICTPFYDKLQELFAQPWYIKHRQFAILSLVQRHINLSSIKTILDYGGDTGELIPSSFKNSKKYVYDLSGRPLLPGVQTIVDVDQKFDLIICAHVLEHESEPHTLVERLKMHMHTNSLLYLEVPYKEQSMLGPNVFDEHINHWSEKSIKKLLEMQDINIIDMTVYDILMNSKTDFALKILAKLNGVS
jgi:hypothetical protein